MKLGGTILLAVIIFTSILSIQSKNDLLTVAEKTGFESTSRYDDVVSFIERLKEISPYIKVEIIARTAEGREVPLIIIGNPPPESAADLKNDKRIVVYFQANIHAGEVEGKEASLMLARDILMNKTPAHLDDIVLLIVPIFNPDGNDKISADNRRNQNGPINGVGIRYNGQNLDLNRDGMKAETPEVRGMITSILNKWDPSIFVDLHTTNGSFHEEPVTFTWMVNPNGDRSLINYMRDKMMPAVSETLAKKYNTLNCFYGEFIDMRSPEKGWEYYAYEPRYLVNYVGIRNRLSILNENYVYADFKTRVLGCYHLLRSILDYASVNKNEIKKMLVNADNKTIARATTPSKQDSFAVEMAYKPTPKSVTINTFEVESYTDQSGRERFRPTDRKKTVTVSYYADYYATKNTYFPSAYLLTVPRPEIIDLLNIHGVKFEKLEKPTTFTVQSFKILELKPAERLDQGHYTNSIKGEYINETKEFSEGTIVIKTGQPLGNLAACLFEPESNDGLLKWNFLDRFLVPQWGRGFLPYPIYKVIK
jgi:hypothetical protein